MSTALLEQTVTGPARPSPFKFWRWAPGTASLVAGVAGAAMAVVAPIANFGLIRPLVTAGDPARTAHDISASAPLFLGAIVGLLVVILLDLVVAGALYALFRPVSRRLSNVAAWLRVVFAGVFAVAVAQLAYALTQTENPEVALQAAESFNTIWVTGLGLFGVHLLVTGYLAFRSGFVPRVFGVLLAIAGAGYIADAIGLQLVPHFTPMFGALLFVGEPAMILWELLRGRRLPLVPAQAV